MQERCEDWSFAMKTKRNAAETRAKILKAATVCFAEKGYKATGNREVAAAAGVSLPLVSRYFGSKSGLLEAALQAALEPKPFLKGPREEFGARLTRMILVASASELPMVTAVLAAADPEAREIARRIVEREVVQPLADWLGPPAAHQRALAITMLGAGLTTHLHILPLNEAQGMMPDSPLIAYFAQAMQRIVDGDALSSEGP